MRKVIPKKLRNRVFAEKGTRCFYCDVDLLTLVPRNRTIDHLNQIYQGGTNDFDNLAPSCRFCNTSRGGATVEEYQWIAKNREYYARVRKLFANRNRGWREVLTELRSTARK